MLASALLAARSRVRGVADEMPVREPRQGCVCRRELATGSDEFLVTAES